MTLTRRRFLAITSAACLAAPTAQAYRWQGTALGAQAQIMLDHPRAIALTEAARAEIDRLENIFSLYRAGSEISVLNAKGRLQAPSFELLECLGLARRVHAVTEGRFDPTVQPLWRTLAEAHVSGTAPRPEALAQARAAIGFHRVRFDATRVVLAPDQQLTLNGIAQGFIADRVARLMQAEGVADVLIDTGEILARGNAPDQRGWPVTIAGEAHSRSLTNRALATSAPLGTRLDGAGRLGHIIDPRQGTLTRPALRQISVSAPSAALADALSTGLCLATGAPEARRMLDKIPEAHLEALFA